jgi:hypothetical protein
MDIKRSMTFSGKERERERERKQKETEGKKRVIGKLAAAEGSAVSQYKKNQKGLMWLLNEKDFFCTWKSSSGSANFCTLIYYRWM